MGAHQVDVDVGKTTFGKQESALGRPENGDGFLITGKPHTLLSRHPCDQVRQT